MDFLHALADRTVIIALAVVGALVATAGGMLKARGAGNAAKLGQAILWAGYIMSAASVVLFIIAGFLSGR